MTRHAKNCTAGAVYTYHEKQKDARASGYGSHSQRIGKDSVKDFDCCCLTLQPCQNPVVTPDGVLYDKAAILEYVLAKREEYTRKTKEYERQKRQHEREEADEAAGAKRARLDAFMQKEKDIVNGKDGELSTQSVPLKVAQRESQPSTSNSVSNMSEGREKDLPSFWIPSKTPHAKKTILSKPDKTVCCPISGNPLKIKELIEVKFTEVNDPDDKKSLIAKTNRFMCAVTHDILSNSVPSCVLKTTGHVVTQECVDRIIKKDWLHPLTGDTLIESHIIPLQRGGTGFSSVNDKLQAKEERPVLQV